MLTDRDRQPNPNGFRIKPVEAGRAVRKEDLDRMRGLQWKKDPERGPENRPKNETAR